MILIQRQPEKEDARSDPEAAAGAVGEARDSSCDGSRQRSRRLSGRFSCERARLIAQRGVRMSQRDRIESIPEARHVRLYHQGHAEDARVAGPQLLRARRVRRAVPCATAGQDSNNGRIPYSVREMADNLPHQSCRQLGLRVFQPLQKPHGFIVEMKTGGRYGRKRTYASEWRLTEFACDVETRRSLATHAYRQWRGSTATIATKDFSASCTINQRCRIIVGKTEPSVQRRFCCSVQRRFTPGVQPRFSYFGKEAS